MERLTIELTECGDSGILAIARGGHEEDRWRLTHELAAVVDHSYLAGVRDVIPTYDSVLVEFDNLRVDPSTVECFIQSAAVSAIRRGVWSTASARVFRVPVVYGGTFGPDLDDVARQLGVAVTEVVDLHTSTSFTVRCRGRGGGPMLHNSAWPQSIRRLPVPRTLNPGGSVAVAGRQATVSGGPGPGGWRVIGRTPSRVVDLTSDPPRAFAPGDRLRFFQIARADWDTYEGRSLSDRHEP